MSHRYLLISLVLVATVIAGCQRSKKAAKKFNDYNDKATVLMTQMQNELIAYEKWMRQYSKEDHSSYKAEIKNRIAKMRKILKDLNAIEVADKEIEDFRGIQRKAVEKMIQIFNLHRSMLNSGAPPFATDEVKKLFGEYRALITDFQQKRDKFKKKYRLKDRRN
ncbi:hypothetical protein KKF34_19990 [Myxococcota bacterium]|nr:hypothetical protein [Myxococcota bacterium]MBU1382994.1 hypothetical protein [Myxococcota bacterium]MBU1499170.1 hypothetical protein [Myxococcota bacterium]